MTSEVTSDHGQHPHSGAQPGAHSVRSVFHVIISRKYKVLCRSHARERESERGCVVLGLCNIRFIQLGTRVHLQRMSRDILFYCNKNNIWGAWLDSYHHCFHSPWLHFPQHQQWDARGAVHLWQQRFPSIMSYWDLIRSEQTLAG